MEFNFEQQSLGSLHKNISSLPSGILRTDITNDAVRHNNYLEYLSICYKTHHGIYIKPDFLWYTFLCELASEIKNKSSKYRSLFTTSNDKKEISIACADILEINIDDLFTALMGNIPNPFPEKIICPEFSTSTPQSIKAFKIAFLDAVSPYYNYSMYMCGFNRIVIDGTIEDYQLLYDRVDYFAELFAGYPIIDYIHSVQRTFKDLIDNFENGDMWESIFYTEPCGSGSQFEVKGWFKNLYKKYPRLGFVCNFNTHVSEIEYTQLNTKRKFKMNSGLLSSYIQNDLLIPNFNFYITEIL